MSETARPPEGVDELLPAHGSGLGARVVREQEEWRTFVAATLGEHAELLYISPADSDRRVYRVNDRIAKIQRCSGSEARHGQELKSEYAALARLRRDPRLDRHPVLEEHGEWGVLWCDYVEGEPLKELWQRAGVWGKVVVAVRAARAVARLHRGGVAHVDMQAPNYVADERGEIHAIDFGDAVVRHPIGAAVVDLRRFLFGRYGLAQRVAKGVFLRLWPNSQQLYRNFKLRRVEPFSARSLGDLDGGREAELLETGWRRAARWNTTAGKWLAYSSLTIGGVHFPGWRPWLLRWTWVRNAVSFEGKTVLDLGCNVGLFCCFALLEGARTAVGIDADTSALEAAQLTAAGLGVAPTFLLMRVGGKDGWQDRVPKADIVAAMSIAEWVDDRKSLFAFFSTVPELVYEGHDSVDVEEDRLRGAGFGHVEVLGVTERGRTVFHATR
jgi:hypothetical protein